MLNVCFKLLAPLEMSILCCVFYYFY